MATTASKERVPNYGMDLTTYLCHEAGSANKENEPLEKSLEKLVRLSLGEILTT
jgi:hypothetical protein